MTLKFKSRLATQHYEEVSEILSDELEKWDNKIMAKLGDDLSVEQVAHMTTNLIQIRCKEFRQCAFEAAQLDIQAETATASLAAGLAAAMDHGEGE